MPTAACPRGSGSSTWRSASPRTARSRRAHSGSAVAGAPVGAKQLAPAPRVASRRTSRSRSRRGSCGRAGAARVVRAASCARAASSSPTAPSQRLRVASRPARERATRRDAPARARHGREPRHRPRLRARRSRAPASTSALGYRADAAAAESVAKELRALGRDARLLCFDVADRAGAAAALERDVARPARTGARCSQRASLGRRVPGAVRRSLGPRAAHQPRRLLQRAAPAGHAARAHARRRAHRHDLVDRGPRREPRPGELRASKAGLHGATKALALELATRRITVNCVAPGLVETEMLAGAPVEELAQARPVAAARPAR